MKDLETKVGCPNCHHQIRIKVKEMVPGRIRHCPYCQTEIRFSGDDGRKTQKELDDFEKSLKDLSR